MTTDIERLRARDVDEHFERMGTNRDDIVEALKIVCDDIEERMADCDECACNLAWQHLNNALAEIEHAKSALERE